MIEGARFKVGDKVRNLLTDRIGVIRFVLQYQNKNGVYYRVKYPGTVGMNTVTGVFLEPYNEDG